MAGTADSAADRPACVPPEAEYLEEWELYEGGPKWPAWAVGERDGDALTGRWQLWRPDGTPLEESNWRDGRRHGTMLRYHDDGTLAVRAEHRDGVPVTVTGHRCDLPSRDPFSFDDLDPVLRTVVQEYDEQGTRIRQACFAADGTEVTNEGGPVPERPAGVPEPATFWPDGEWSAPRWRQDGVLEGVARHWTGDGTADRLVYNRDGREVARFPRGDAKTSPLIEAARDGDAASVALCLEAGLGASPGAARHAAFEGLPELALRLLRSEPPEAGQLAEVRTPPAVPSTGVPEDAAWVAGLLAFVDGAVDGTTGAAVGTWRLWEQAWESTSDTEGPSYYKPDSFYHGYEEADFADGRQVERRKYLNASTPYRLKRYRPDGATLLDREYKDGVPRREQEWPADGSIVQRRFHADGALRAERTERDGVLVTERWYGADGTRAADVMPTDVTVDGAAVELWRAVDAGGAVIAEGYVEPGIRGGPVGDWRVFDTDTGTDGTRTRARTELGTVTFEGLDLARDEDLGTAARALHTWRAAPVPSELHGVEEVPWEGLETFYGDPEDVPFLLKGLAVGDPEAFYLALGELSDLLLHQHTITVATGPAFRYMAALADRVDDAGPRTALLEFLTDIATRDGSLGAARELKRILADLPADDTDPDEHFADHGAESAYHEVYTVLADTVPTWTGQAAHEDAGIRRLAVVLLAAAPGDAAAKALHGRLTVEPESRIRAEILLGLALHEAGPDTLRALERHLADDDPLLRFCAALTWVRTHRSPARPGAGPLVEALRGDLDAAGFADLYLGSGDPATDAATALALLPSEQAEPLLAELCAVLDEVNAIDAVSVANALLDIVFPTEAYDDGEPLTDAQRTVIRAIADSTGAWEFKPNLCEVLDVNGLPREAGELRTLADTAPAATPDAAPGAEPDEAP
ncbi:toxin-antitoxin system YwqK family antitoxin [Kitasatospora sp. NPDC058032]|uniref:toxin-antitoxin system YwqK family antitoxin n=1 Tax=Kitasatospora sp. NPDC058032 TaxID=3346307 RepID=UPI0036DEE15C